MSIGQASTDENDHLVHVQALKPANCRTNSYVDCDCDLLLLLFPLNQQKFHHQIAILDEPSLLEW